MKVVVRSRTCTITFGEQDPYFAGKTLVLEGEGIDNFSFCVHKHLDIFWTTPSIEDFDRAVGTVVDGIERENLLSYVIKSTKENGYTLTVW